jgi:excisionase family DNA binding protein
MTPTRNGTKIESASAIDPLSLMIRAACEAAVRGVLNIATDISPRRLLSVDETATYLCLSEREVYNMISNHKLAGVRHGKRVMLDLQDLDSWIANHKDEAA